MDELDPLSHRDRVALLFPEWVVKLLGPYADEVGWGIFLGKWLVIGFLLERLLGGLVSPEMKRQIGETLVLGGLFLMAWAALPHEDD